MSEAGVVGPEWWFYHLERTPLVRAAAPLMEKCLERGWRVLAVSPDADRRAMLDAGLWTYSDQSFLPHGEAGAEGCDPTRQPVLIAGELDNLNGAEALFLMDSAQAPADAPFLRCMVMFDGHDTVGRQAAREQFKSAKDAGFSCRYFQQTAGGGWKETT